WDPVVPVALAVKGRGLSVASSCFPQDVDRTMELVVSFAVREIMIVVYGRGCAIVLHHRVTYLRQAECVAIGLDRGLGEGITVLCHLLQRQIEKVIRVGGQKSLGQVVGLRKQKPMIRPECECLV